MRLITWNMQGVSREDFEKIYLDLDNTIYQCSLRTDKPTVCLQEAGTFINHRFWYTYCTQTEALLNPANFPSVPAAGVVPSRAIWNIVKPPTNCLVRGYNDHNYLALNIPINIVNYNTRTALNYDNTIINLSLRFVANSIPYFTIGCPWCKALFVPGILNQRCSLAILSPYEITAGVLDIECPIAEIYVIHTNRNYQGVPSRPALGVRYRNNEYVFTIHAFSPNGPDQADLLECIYDAISPLPADSKVFVAGDFNNNHPLNWNARWLDTRPNVGDFTHSTKYVLKSYYDRVARYYEPPPVPPVPPPTYTPTVLKNITSSDHFPVLYVA